MMLRAGLFAAGALLSTMAAVAAPPAGYQLVWQDDFKVPALDARKWLAYDKLRDSARLTPAAIAVGGGNLRISTYTDNGVHHTGFLTTSGRYQPRFGYFEARIRFKNVFAISQGSRSYVGGMGCKARCAVDSPAIHKRRNAADRPPT